MRRAFINLKCILNFFLKYFTFESAIKYAGELFSLPFPASFRLCEKSAECSKMQMEKQYRHEGKMAIPTFHPKSPVNSCTFQPLPSARHAVSARPSSLAPQIVTVDFHNFRVNARACPINAHGHVRLLKKAEETFHNGAPLCRSPLASARASSLYRCEL